MREYHGRECPTKSVKEAAVREYWIVRRDAAGRSWWWDGMGLSTKRVCAKRYPTRELAHGVTLARSEGIRRECRIIHVTVRPAAERAKLEAKLEEARSFIRARCYDGISRRGQDVYQCQECWATAPTVAGVCHAPDCPVGRVLA